MKRRWLVIAIALLGYMAIMSWLMTFLVFGLFVSQDSGFAGLGVMFRPAEWELDEGVWWAFCGLPTAVLCTSQMVFLIPVVAPRPLEHGRAKSLTLSMILAGFVAMALTFGLLTGALGLLQLILANSRGVKDPSDIDPGESFIGWVFLAAIVLGWLFWSVLLIRFARRRHGRGVFGRVVGWLLAGTIVEILVVLPVDIMVRRRTDCYCAVGSFWTLVIAGWCLLWLTGPGIVIAVMSKRRRLWDSSHCRMCGYQKGPAPAERCPECGFDWRVGVALAHARPAAASRAA